MSASDVKYLRRARLASWALMIGAIVNCSFLLEGYLGSELNRRTSFISEHNANGQPAQTFYRLSVLVAGTLLVVGGVACYRLLPDSRWVRVGDLSAVVVGAITMVNSTVPLDCTPSTSETCRTAEKIGEVSLSHQIHNVTGILEPFFGVAALVLIGFGLWRLRQVHRLPPQWTGLALLLSLVAAQDRVQVLRLQWRQRAGPRPATADRAVQRGDLRYRTCHAPLLRSGGQEPR